MADISKAIRYNEKAATQYGWYDDMPAKARLEHPGLGRDPVNGTQSDKTQFALSVQDYQTSADPSLDADGMLGPSTWEHIEEHYGDETVPVDWNISSAVSYNQRSAKSVGWYQNFTQAALDSYLGWKKDAISGSQGDKEVFAKTTHQFQKAEDFGPGDIDGKLGPGTWAAISKLYAEPIKEGARVYIHNNKRVTPDEEPFTFVDYGVTADLVTIPYDQADGLDLHKWGHFSSRNGTKPRLLVIHWGGIDSEHLFRVFSSPSRKVSSHGGIGRNVFYQYLDLKHSAWHAGFVNRYSVGIDICQQPTRNWLGHYQAAGYEVSNATNEARRPGGSVVGEKSIISLDPKIAAATRQVVFDLCEVLGIPLRAPRGEDGLAANGEVWHGVFSRAVLDGGDFAGVIGHHHISSHKWDMACWWDEIFKGTELG